MDELELSLMLHNPQMAQHLQPLLDRFQAQQHLRVKLRIVPWDRAWADLVKVALYNYGPDVSEIGTTWMGNLVAMNALRPFEPNEVRSFGGPEVFLPSAWQSASLAGERQIWALPWQADTRVLYYRRDLLAKAGVAEQQAFTTAQHLAQTLDRLQASGFELPWTVPTRHTTNTLHNIACWVWSAGGDFVSADGKRILFNHPAALAGIQAYFDLQRYLQVAARGLDAGASNLFYREGHAAVTISGPWTLQLMRESAAAEVAQNTGVALPLGLPFVGGSNLVIWKHTRHSHAAVELVRMLTDQQGQIVSSRASGLLPTRLDVTLTDPSSQLMVLGLKQGRSFPSLPLWGLIEDGLVSVLAQIWDDLLSHDPVDLDAVIKNHLDPLAARLSPILNS
jgi:multiple sugar transport system substrate-binding protein